MNRRHRRGGVVWPILLIGFGVLLLLTNLGVLSLDLWDFFLRTWPLLLIAIGIDLLIGWRSRWGGLLAFALVALLFVGGLWLYSAYASQPLGAPIDFRQPMQGTRRATVSLGLSFADLNLSAGASRSALAEAEIVPAGGGKPGQSFSLESGSATYRLESEADEVIFLVGPRARSSWTVRLSGDVPLRLEVDQAVGSARLDLRGLRVESLNVNLAVGQMTLLLPAEKSLEGLVRVAVGKTVIIVPEGVGLRLVADRGLTSLSLPDDYTCDDKVCTSPGYERAAARVQLDVEQAIGAISVEEGSEPG